MTDAVAGALLGTFAGDALGMPYEGMPGDAVPHALEMRPGRAPAGSYTDDTEMMIALAESLLRCGVVDPEDLARTFLAHHDPGRGYGSGTRTVLSLWEQGTPVSEAARLIFDGQGSRGNGAAMRVAPVGARFFSQGDSLRTQARRSAAVTHAHPEGIDGAVVQAAAVAAAVRGADPLPAAVAAAETEVMRDRLEHVARTAAAGLDPRLLGGPEWRVSSLAADSVPVAIVAGSLARSFEEAVTVAVRSGGDTDTVGAMAGAIAGARFGAGSIPVRWYEALENGERGRSHVERLAKELAAAAG